MATIKFSIIIPVKAINDYVRETVPYIQALDGNEWELIILPNELDGNEWEDARIRIIPSGKVGPARKRDLGATYAAGEILVFLDDDSYPNSNLLKIASPHLQNNEIVAIGGPGITPPTDNFWQRVSGAVFLSKYSGGAPERYISIGNVREVSDWPSVNLMVRTKEFLEIGGFNTDFWPGEDTKLCLDLINKTGKKILYIPQMIVWHHRRAGLFSHLKQVGAYGLHRGYFAKRYPKTSLKVKYFMPSIIFGMFLSSLFFLYLPPIFIALLLIAWFSYAIALLKAAFEMTKYEGLIVAIAATPYVVLTHLAYGFKFIQGFLFKKSLVSKLR